MRHWPVPLVAVHDFSGDQCGQRGLLVTQLTRNEPPTFKIIVGLLDARQNGNTDCGTEPSLGFSQRLPIEGGLLRPWVLAQASAR